MQRYETRFVWDFDRSSGSAQSAHWVGAPTATHRRGHPFVVAERFKVRV